MEYDLREDLVPDTIPSIIVQSAASATNYGRVELSEVSLEEDLPKLGDAGDFVSQSVGQGEGMSEIVRQIRADLMKPSYVKFSEPVGSQDDGALD